MPQTNISPAQGSERRKYRNIAAIVSIVAILSFGLFTSRSPSDQDTGQAAAATPATAQVNERDAYVIARSAVQSKLNMPPEELNFPYDDYTATKAGDTYTVQSYVTRLVGSGRTARINYTVSLAYNTGSKYDRHSWNISDISIQN